MSLTYKCLEIVAYELNSETVICCSKTVGSSHWTQEAFLALQVVVCYVVRYNSSPAFLIALGRHLT